MIQYPISSSKKPLKVLLKEPRHCGQLCKNMLIKQISSCILSPPENRVRKNDIAINISNLEASSPEII